MGKNLLSSRFLLPIVRGNRSKCTVLGVRKKLFLSLGHSIKRKRTSSQEERMKFNKWTLALAAGGVVSLGSIAQADEKPMSQVMTAVSSTTLSGYVDTSAIWKFGTGNVNLPGRQYDGPTKQAYVSLRVPAANGIDLKAGVFDPIIGYESFESYLNPNFSRSYGHGLEPKQHTGVLASYKATDAVSFSAGVANTYNNAFGLDNVNARPRRAGGA